MKSNKSIAMLAVPLLITCLFGSLAYSKDQLTSFRKEKQQYFNCIEEAQAIHPKIITCIHEEVETHKNSIEKTIDTASKDASLETLITSIKKSEKTWNMYINELCDSYYKLGGQRGELLRESCILNETNQREQFVKEILKEADI